MSGTDPDAPISLAIHDGIARIGLRRPQRHNSLVPELLRALLAGLAQAQSDLQVRAVLLYGHGASFSTGGDLQAFLANWDHVQAYAQELVGLLNEVILAILRMDKPVIAALHGFTTGGSLGLAFASDAVLAASDARLGAYYGRVGFSPDGGCTVLLPALVGMGRARAFLLLDRPLAAQEAMIWGLVTELVPPEDLHRRATELAWQASRLSPASIRRAKALLHADIDTVVAGLERERQEFVRNLASEGVRASVEAYLAQMRRKR